MNAKELLQQGKLGEAVEAAIAHVKAAPGDVPARIFLFELLAAAGEWRRAQKHLDVVADRAKEMADGVTSYRLLLDAEQARSRLFDAGEGEPQRMTLVPLDPEPHLSALRRLRAGDATEARRLLDAAAEAAPARPATVDGTEVPDFRDADDVLAPFLEVIAKGVYGWIPFAQIAKITFDPPRTIRDLLWRPAEITLADASTATMFVPARYPGSERHADDQTKLGRATDWLDIGGVVQGAGQRAFAAGDDLRYILELTEITFASA
jgi:type VI secretion system protein ImpE